MTEKKTQISELETFYMKSLYKQIESGYFDEAKEIIDVIRCIGELRSGRKIEEINYIKESQYIEKIKDFIINNKEEPFELKKIELSASKIEVYESCPLKYKYKYDLNIPGKKVNPNLILGNMIHKVLQLFHSDLKPNKDKEILMDLLKENWDSNSFVIKNQESQFKKDANFMLNNYYQEHCSKYLDAEILSVEQDFNVKFDKNIVLTGRCDRIDQNFDKSIHVIDYKTSQNFKTSKQILKDMQLGIYSIFLKEQYNDKRDIFASLLYLRNSDEIIVTNKFSNADLDLIHQRIFEVAKGIQSNGFKAKKGFHCNYCDYKDFICPIWIEN